MNRPNEALKDSENKSNRENQVHQVRGSYICALIDVIIPVLNNRLQDKPTDRNTEGRGRVQKHLRARE